MGSDAEKYLRPRKKSGCERRFEVVETPEVLDEAEF